jgi:flagellar hook-associated protein 2
MAEGILGLGSSGSNGLSQELIDKLKKAEAKGQVDPYTKDLEKWDKELEKIDEINLKTTELLNAIKDFDLYKSGTNAFEQVSASTTGSAVVFDALDASSLDTGTTSVTVTQLAKKDVFQTDTFSDNTALVAGGQDPNDMITIEISGAPEYQSRSTSAATSTDLVGAGTIRITPDGLSNIDIATTATTTWDELRDLINANTNLNASYSNNRLVIKNKVDDTKTLAISDLTGTVTADLGISRGRKFTTVGKTYDQLASDININSKLNASVEQVADSSFRLVVKGKESGTANALTITESGLSMNYSQTQTSQNLQATVDGVAYDVSSNSITINGNLTMTAVELGTSTLSIQKDNSGLIPQLKTVVEKYNELIDLVDDELFSADSVINDPSSLRMMMGQLKDLFYGSYGPSDDLNVFNYGFTVDKTGHVTIDETLLGKALTDNLDDIKALFIGSAEKPGLGTKMKEYVDGLDGFEGLLSAYGDNMVKRKEKLEEDKEKAQATLDNKYRQMSLQFASYTAIISQMEAAFGGMKMMMDQSTAG